MNDTYTSADILTAWVCAAFGLVGVAVLVAVLTAQPEDVESPRSRLVALVKRQAEPAPAPKKAEPVLTAQAKLAATMMKKVPTRSALTRPMVAARHQSLSQTWGEGWTWPSSATRINSGFGPRVNPITGAVGQVHRGVDIGAPEGTEVLATEAGLVTFAQWTDSSGNTIEVVHAHGWTSRYAHLSRLDVSAGQTVLRGESMGLSGSTGRLSTGPHLHFELWHDGTPVNPLSVTFERPAAPLVASTETEGQSAAMGTVEDELTESDD